MPKFQLSAYTIQKMHMDNKCDSFTIISKQLKAGMLWNVSYVVIN